MADRTQPSTPAAVHSSHSCEQSLQRRTAPGVRPAHQVVVSVVEVEGHEVRWPLPRRGSGSCSAPGELADAEAAYRSG
ncbi:MULTISPECIES: hypothetical protein [Streptomyces]|uniref:hypothetical protein n=1 Tax=Streptomyces TaxID=1883 RepID=UPI00287F8A9F|nr:hypothetical protein [Streptomyces sp. CGMCC 4.1456]WNF67329.1 hypothetical protein RJD14_34350 [Streptomyces sp. CGMCC 4.1456]